MWNTPEGNRILQTAEAHVYGQTLLELIDAIRAERELDVKADYGIPAFDDLEWQQKLAMLLHVSRALLLSDVAEPTASSLRDATVGAVYAQMLSGVVTEIEMQQATTDSRDDDTVRRIEIISALNEVEPDQRWPDAECVVVDEWEVAVLALQNRVLADEDWRYSDQLLDIPPEKADAAKQFLGIDGDYAMESPPDVEDLVAKTIWADLVELASGERPDEDVFDLPGA